jgi:hypothetical protein
MTHQLWTVPNISISLTSKVNRDTIFHYDIIQDFIQIISEGNGTIHAVTTVRLEIEMSRTWIVWMRKFGWNCIAP